MKNRIKPQSLIMARIRDRQSIQKMIERHQFTTTGEFTVPVEPELKLRGYGGGGSSTKTSAPVENTVVPVGVGEQAGAEGEECVQGMASTRAEQTSMNLETMEMVSDGERLRGAVHCLLFPEPAVPFMADDVPEFLKKPEPFAPVSDAEQCTTILDNDEPEPETPQSPFICHYIQDGEFVISRCLGSGRYGAFAVILTKQEVDAVKHCMRLFP